MAKFKARKKAEDIIEVNESLDGVVHSTRRISELENKFIVANKGKIDRQMIELAAAPGQMSATREGQYLGKRVPAAMSLIDKIQNEFLPKTNEEAIDFSYNWYGIDDMLGDLIDIKTKFTLNGFELFALEKNSIYLNDLLTLLKKTNPEDEITGDENNKASSEEVSGLNEDAIGKLIELIEFNEKLSNFSMEYQLESVTEQLIKDYSISDTMILYWRTVGSGAESQEIDAEVNLELLDTPVKGIIDINALSPSDVLWDNSLGQDELRVRMPDAIKVRIDIALNQDDKSLKTVMLEGLISNGVTQNYIDAVENGDDFVLLDRELGDNWAIVTRERNHYGMAKPSMTKIFIPLATRKMNTDGEFSASLMMKHFIFHIKLGESITSGPNSGSTRNWATQPECEFYMEKFRGVNKTTVIATNHTVEFEFVHPPVEMFSLDKYLSSNSRILNFVGVSMSLYTGEGSTYSGGFLSIKRLMSDISYIRTKIRYLYRRMFSDEMIIEALELQPENSIEARFSELHLKEQKQVLDEITELLKNKLIGPRDTLTELGRSSQNVRFDRMIASVEDKVFNVWGGTFSGDNENNGNNKNGTNDNNNESGTENKNAGRPPNSGTTPNEGTRNQSPTP